jgi:hypothetical protein
MQVLQDGLIQEFPRHLVPAVAEVVRIRFREVVHGVSFDPNDNTMIGTTEGVILGGSKELAAMFPEPDSILETWLLIDEMEDRPWADVKLPPVRRLTWDELVGRRRQPHKSWKFRRETRYHTVNDRYGRWV